MPTEIIILDEWCSDANFKCIQNLMIYEKCKKFLIGRIMLKDNKYTFNDKYKFNTCSIIEILKIDPSEFETEI